MSKPTSRRTRILRGAAALTVSVLLISLVVGRADVGALCAALAATRIPWVGAAFLAFGVGMALAATRWSLVLEAGGLAEPRFFILRLSCVGHCFNMLLLGPVGGDLAKAAVFARWKGRPGAKALAACAIDRLLAAGGSILYGCITLTLIAFCGGLERLGSLHVSGPAWRVPLLVAVVVGAAGWRFRDRLHGNVFLKQSWGSFRDVIARFGDSRRLPAYGVGLALLMQMIWSGVLAVCLFAVAGTTVAWSDTLWVFPIVSTVSALPISVAGAGVREGTAVLLLRTCGVAGADALAAALLTSAVYVAWAGVGAALAWREEMVFARSRL